MDVQIQGAAKLPLQDRDGARAETRPAAGLQERTAAASRQEAGVILWDAQA